MDRTPKRQRDPLEEKVLVPNELEAVQKKMRLASDGVENLNPLQSEAASSVQEHQPTPSPLDEAALRQRSLQQDVYRIGESKFSARLERFKQTSSDCRQVFPSSSRRHLSSFVLNRQQQLQAASSLCTLDVSRIRRSRDIELELLRVPPLTENMWLKRSASDPVLMKEDISTIDSKEVKDLTVSEEPNELSEEMLFPESGHCAAFQTNEEMDTSDLIDKMYEDVLQAADKEEVQEQEVDKDQQINEMKEEDPDAETTELILKSEDDEVEIHQVDFNVEIKEDVHSSNGEEVAEKKKQQTACNEEELEIKEKDAPSTEEDLMLPPSCVLSPLSNHVEAVLMPLIASVSSVEGQKDDNPPNASPLYSIDAYHCALRKNTSNTSSCAIPGITKKTHRRSHVKPFINTKDVIKNLNEETARLQTVIHQTLQALSCCSDEQHGQGSVEEAEAEKLLLVSTERHAALLAEISQLRRGTEVELNSDTLQPCRGTVSISSIQLPLTMEFVHSARKDCPTYYFFILVRYGVYNIVSTSLATVADAENGDTIIFPTSITLKDIRSNFEIDVEVYSLSNVSNTSTDNMTFNSSTKSRLTPRKLLNSITKSTAFSNPGTSSTLDFRRPSKFCLVGSHRITLASLGKSKFSLDKMKFEGKIGRLLGDEFQEKVPFLSPLEGHIYLQLHCKSHSNIQHQGFLTMFDVVAGFGTWERLYFKLDVDILLYWNHPNKIGNKFAEGSISLCGFDRVMPVRQKSCARPHTFELVNSKAQMDDSHTMSKIRFSADTREEQTDWVEKLSQVLLDLQMWSQQHISESNSADTSTSTAASRESTL